MGPNPLHELALHLLHDDYQRARDLIQARTGLSFGEKRRHVLAQALYQGAQRFCGAELNAYFAQLEMAPTDSEIWDHLIELLTISETYFFRDAEQMEALRSTILPALISSHLPDRTLRIWSAGCATGEEPYSLAILLQQLLPDIAQWNILILATDINKGVLRTAALGRFKAWSFRQTEVALRSTYFGQEGDYFMLWPQLREKVTFAYLNLAEAVYPAAANGTCDLDLILCRNVIIYLPQDVTQGIVQRFQQCLKPGGWLMVGASESCSDIYTHSQLQLTRAGSAMVYRKTAESTTGQHPTTHGFSPLSTQQVKAENHGYTRAKHAANGDADITAMAPPAAVEKPGQDCPSGDASNGYRRYSSEQERLHVCLHRKPRCVGAQLRLARIEADCGRLSEAQRWAQQVLEHDPLCSEAHYLMGLVHEEQGEIDQAIARFRKVIYLEPNFALAHFSLGNLYGRIGRMKDASRHRALAVRVAAGMAPGTVLHGSDDMTAGSLLDMVRDVDA